MSLSVQIDIRDGATPTLQAILDSFALGRLKGIAGLAATQRVKMHLHDLDAQGNQLGGKSRHYYSEQAQFTHWEPTADGVRLGIGQPNRGMALHYFGGDLGPENLVNATNYAIPARAEAHGMVPGDFPGQLEVLWGRNGPYALARHLEMPRLKKRGEGRIKDQTPGQGYGEILFILTKHIHFEPDRSVIPTEQEIAFAIVGAIYDRFRAAKAGGKS
jgi:hypothetical protein